IGQPDDRQRQESGYATSLCSNFPDYGEPASEAVDELMRPRSGQARISEVPTWLPDCSRKTSSPRGSVIARTPPRCMTGTAGMAKLTRGNRQQPSYRPSMNRASCEHRRPASSRVAGAVAIEQVQGGSDELRATRRELLDVECSQYVDRGNHRAGGEMIGGWHGRFLRGGRQAAAGPAGGSRHPRAGRLVTAGIGKLECGAAVALVGFAHPLFRQ